jgi:hypothetical protein
MYNCTAGNLYIYPWERSSDPSLVLAAGDVAFVDPGFAGTDTEEPEGASEAKRPTRAARMKLKKLVLA